MEPSSAALLGGVIGALLSTVTILVFRLRERDQQRVPPAPEPLVPNGVAAVLSVLRSSALVVGPDDEVLKATAPAHQMGLVSGSRVTVGELLEMVRRVRRDGQIREDDLVLRRGRSRAVHLAARVAPLGSRLILILVEDRTHAHRVDAIRRDFVANVSHELKTPVGALNLLAEAVGEAAEDPEAIQRFSTRMRTESERLTRLVQQIIELSRLQGDDPLQEADQVAVDVIADRAIDRVRVDAADKGVYLSYAGEGGFHVRGNSGQLVVALGNLVENAVVYSAAGTRVTVAARTNDSMVDIVVTDQGVGIPAAEVERIFERFYRVDPARARSTGGTGLGLSIVKHVAATHGGEVRVWSVEGEGSTFTLSLPTYAQAESEAVGRSDASLPGATQPDPPTVVTVPSAFGSVASETHADAVPAQRLTHQQEEAS